MAMPTESTNGTSEPAKAAHVNMMVDTIIANLPSDALRPILRSLLGVDAKVAPAFQSLATKFLESTKPTSLPVFFKPERNEVTPELHEFQKRYRCLMGCGKGFESLQAITEVIRQAQKLDVTTTKLEETTENMITVIDSDIVQAVTALHKQLSTASGSRALTKDEEVIIQDLQDAIDSCDNHFAQAGYSNQFGRASSTLSTFLGHDEKTKDCISSVGESRHYQYKPSSSSIETTTLGEVVVSRMFMGLWQFSSPAWGSASYSNIHKDFRKHVDAGFVAYGK